MGHLSLAVGLTYLRGVEVSELEVCDREKKISTEIYIDKKKWDNSNKMVNTDHPSYIPINKKINSKKIQ